MAERYVRVRSASGEVHYGLLELNQAVVVLDRAPWLGGNPTGAVLPPETYKLLAPCEPSKVVAVGKNYGAHAAEMGEEVPVEPLLFLKPSSAIVAVDDTILLPPQSQQVEYEGELALTIGTPCSNLLPKEALNAIWGYTIANDVTARDLQRRDGQWTRAKGFDTFCPLGPWIVRDISPTALLQTSIERGGDRNLVQSATIDTMTFSPEQIVAYISQIMTLLPGDVVLTGTPAGVGILRAGDRVVVEIEGIGKLHNRVAHRAPLPVEGDLGDLLEEVPAQ